MEKRLNVILSTNGPLHLCKAANYISKLVDLTVIQAFIPRCWNKWLIPFFSVIVGRDLSKSFAKREIKNVSKNISIGIPEFLWVMTKKMGFSNSTIEPICATMYGFISKFLLQKADIFHVRSGSGAAGAIKKARVLGAKIIVDHSIAHPDFIDKTLEEEYETSLLENGISTKNPFWKEIVNECTEADVILVNSEFVKKTFLRYGFETKQFAIITQGTRSDFFYLKKDYNTHAPIRLLFTGSFDFRKGAVYMLKALCFLDSINFKYEFIVLGTYNQNLIEKYSPIGLKAVGYVPQDELKEYLSTSDMYIFPSLCEGCASSGLEAMAAGLPVIATENSGLPITNNENGIIVPIKDSQAIANAILLLSTDHELRTKIGKNAANLIATKFTWEQYAEKVVNLYYSVLD